MRVGERGHQLQVHPLVDDAVEAEPRVRQGGLVGGIVGRRQAARLGEVGTVHAGGEGVDVGVPAALGLVQAVAAGEHHVGQAHQIALQLLQPLRRELEGGEFVHAVVNDRRRGFGDVAGELQHHGRVVPGDRLLHAALGDQPVEQAADRLGHLLGRQALRQHRRHHRHARLVVTLQPRRRVGRRHGLLEHDDLLGLGEAGHQVLGPLEHELPTQVGEADEGVAAAMPEESRRDDGRSDAGRNETRRLVVQGRLPQLERNRGIESSTILQSKRSRTDMRGETAAVYRRQMTTGQIKTAVQTG